MRRRYRPVVLEQCVGCGVCDDLPGRNRRDRRRCASRMDGEPDMAGHRLNESGHVRRRAAEADRLHPEAKEWHAMKRMNKTDFFEALKEHARESQRVSTPGATGAGRCCSSGTSVV